MDRELPKWMFKVPENVSFEKNQGSSKYLKKSVLEDCLPYLEFPGSIIYSNENNDCSFLSEDIRGSLEAGSALGFDIEWPPTFSKGKQGKVALIQLCGSEKKCYLFHVSAMSGFPSALKRLLEDESIKKVGVGINGDAWKLMSDYDIKMKNTVELVEIANMKLKCYEKWSLDGLVKHLFKKQLLKEKSVRCSNWSDFILTEEQKKYAAIDAYAGFIIYKQLERIDPGQYDASPVETAAVHEDIKDKLHCLSMEMQELSTRVPEEIRNIEGAESILDDISLKLNNLRSILKGDVFKEEILEEHHTLLPMVIDKSSDLNVIHNEYELNQKRSTDNESDKQGMHIIAEATDVLKCAQSNLNREISHQQQNEHVQRECMMSLDITEYELQMLEKQAIEENDLEEHAILAQDDNLVDEGADVSFAENDEELEHEMIKCLDEMDKLNETGYSVDIKSSAKHNLPNKQIDMAVTEEEDEGIEEEIEEWDPSLPEPSSKHIKCLKMYFGHSSFKPVQWKVVYSVLEEKKDNLVVMATGYGKSLCFQFPPVYCGGVGVVISPLISLMEDQILQLKMSNIPACFLGSAQTENVFQDLKNGYFRVLYMTPEFCSGNTNLLKQLNHDVGITLIAVDEAHCISEWGHDFRSAYRNLGLLKELLPNVPIIALTATASPSIRQDIIKSLNLDNPQITCTNFDRPNLFLDVHRKSGSIIQDIKKFLIKKDVGEYEFEGPTIIYCPSRKVTEQVSREMLKLGINSAVYHAGMGIRARRETHHRFMRDEIQCVVATIAFGMGINKADIRKVIHYGAPKEMEAYYQEIGRAGRDGLPSACHVVWTSGDMAINRHLLNNMKSEKFKVYKLKMMAKMEQYLSSMKCRRKIILSHFEDKKLRKVSLGIIGTDRCCDNCKSRLIFDPMADESEPDLQDFGKEAYQLLSSISALGEKFGTTVPILFLRGSNSQRLPDKFRKHSLFGSGRSIPENWLKALARQLVMEGYINEYTGRNIFSVCCGLTQKGRSWLSKANNESYRTLLLQSNNELCSRVSTMPKYHQTGSTSLPPADKCSKTDQQKSLHAQSSFPKYNHGNLIQQSPQASSLKSHSKSLPCQPKAFLVSPREQELQSALYGLLVAARQKIAMEKDIPPAILATNKILLEFAKTRPTTVENMKKVDGVSEAKSTMMVPFLDVINEFCQRNDLEANKVCNSSFGEKRSPLHGLHTSCNELSDSGRITYRLFEQQGMSLERPVKKKEAQPHCSISVESTKLKDNGTEDKLPLDLPISDTNMSSQKPAGHPKMGYDSSIGVPRNKAAAAALSALPGKDLDEDTKELFEDSQSAVQQSTKRKLPVWFEAPKNSAVVHAAAKKAKTKKGIFK
ncbi:bifunctional 3'-5' exonuclease/ATP-dependent helicase WRN isoform X2 [Erpetoichthys calabaricus]|uniref:bifunctional 3'-5' exonuclease/ATP-dependent helicase WRN isoform X2 n=1 Tax=Erpetoichthys calabaricus TaxID=27687 RepID=UPI0022347A42|nr:bifunctional 3'-5' exonuclease/ATP-dependent helicase WRN isoform X2 [Erpetoichthys calabaricus]